MLQATLRKIELQLDSLGPDVAPRASEDQRGDATLSGFSTALVAILVRLVQQLCRVQTVRVCLRKHLQRGSPLSVTVMYPHAQSHEEVQKEVTVRRHLEEQLGEQRQLIDALTAESLLLHQDNTALQVGLGTATPLL